MATAIERARRSAVRKHQRNRLRALVTALRADHASDLHDVWQGQVLAAFWGWSRQQTPDAIEAAIRHLQDVADERIRCGEDLPTFKELLQSLPQTPSGGNTPRLPRRAQWLRDQMCDRKLTPHALEQRGRLSKHTIARILRGDTVLDDSLVKLVDALNHRQHQSTHLTLADIPSE